MLHKSLKVMQFQLRENRCSMRTLLIFTLIGMFVFSTLQPVNDLAEAYDIGITPWAFPLLCNDYICQLVIMAGAVLLYCNAPFRSEAHTYILTRSGNTPWALGNCLYIAVMALAYVLFLVLISLLAILPHLEFSWTWGKAWNSLPGGDYRYTYGITLLVNPYILGHFTPWEALWPSLALEWACCVFLGLVSYCINDAAHSMLGSVISAGFVLLDLAVANAWYPWFYHISPVTMAQLAALSSAHSTYGITRRYAAGFFIGAISLLCAYSVFLQSGKRRKIHD